MRAFVEAQWRNRAFVTYAVGEERIKPLLPPGTQPDLFQGQALVSLVASEVADARVRRIGFPFRIQYTEVTLETYLRRGTNHGLTVFCRVVPRYCLSFWGERLFSEQYHTLPMEFSHTETAARRSLEHTLWQDKHAHKLKFHVSQENRPVMPDSLEAFLFQREASYVVDRSGRTLRYTLNYNPTETATFVDGEVHLGFEKVFGDRWGFLGGLKPLQMTFVPCASLRVFAPLPALQLEAYTD